MRMKRIAFGANFSDAGFTSTNTSFTPAQNEELAKLVNDWKKRDFLMKEFFELVECVKSLDRTKQHYGIIGLRKLLSKGKPPFHFLFLILPF